jgi:ferredoxin--NADP+ reductase
VTQLPRDDGRHIAVVGAGPAGLYALQAALAVPGVVRVDVFDMLPAPYGLVRYGVAADHAKTKSVVRVFQRELEKEQVRFFGNVRLGVDIHREDLRRHYDAVIYATGARHDRDLGIPGDHLPGSHAAAEFVSWYSGHPDAEHRDLLSAGTAAAVVGAGNVALDVVRILAKDARELVETDMPDAVVDLLRTSTLTDIHLLARGGPAQAKFTPVELRELGELANADVIVDPTDLLLDESSRQLVASRDVATNLKLFTAWARRLPAGKPRRIHIHFWTSPLAVVGNERVTGLAVSTRKPNEQRGADADARIMDVQLVIRAIGYRPDPLPELPFDDARHVVPNLAGRIVGVDDRPLAGEYVAGWLKRGPSGVIGTNRGDAVETVARLAEDLPDLPIRPVTDPTALPALLAQRGVRTVDWAGWKRLERHEATLGLPRGATSVKVSGRQAMLDICQSGAAAGLWGGIHAGGTSLGGNPATSG